MVATRATTRPTAVRRMAGGLFAGMLSLSGPGAAAAVVPPPAGIEPSGGIDLGHAAASSDVRDIVEWARSGDARGLPFVVVDKIGAKVFVFDRDGRLLGASAALLGLGHGDDSVPGIGQRRLKTIAPSERTTPAGRFQASLGSDFEQDILWIDYSAALSLHRVIVGNPKDHRARRLTSASPLDNRISYGCINVPAAFYDAVVAPIFAGTVGIVYILPETRAMRDVFTAVPRN